MSTIRLLGYIAAALIALQPFLESEVKTGNRFEVTRYIFRIVVTVMIAVLGKYLKDREFSKENNAET